LATRFTVVVRDADGSELDAWRPHAVPVRAGRRLVVCPAWVAYEAAADDIVVAIDPAHSFGLTHPTTLGALGALETIVGPGTTVLEVGCGSGILAIAAEVLARHVDAIDIDDDAPSHFDNATRNGVAGVVEVRDGSIAEIDTAYDVVVANLLLPVIESLGSSLLARCFRRPSRARGLLVGQDASDRGCATGTRRGRAVVDGWVTVVTRRSSAA
jgi:ribosomal protein L11 methyltransferase